MATVEARTSSSRLPGKNLRPILGEPMIVRLLERLCRCRSLDAVCVATSTDRSDDALARVAADAGALVHRGPLDDVLLRVVEACREANADVCVRITSDCPLTDPLIVDAVVGRYLAGTHDNVSNVLDHPSFPIGLDVQVQSVALLEEVEKLTLDPRDRESVTSFLYRNPDRYRLLNLRAPPDLDRPGYRLCVDYEEDLELVSRVFAALYPRDPKFGPRSVVRYLDARPDLVALNTRREDSFVWPTSGGYADQEVLHIEPE